MSRGGLASLLLLAPALAAAGSYTLSGVVDTGYGRTDAVSGGVSSTSPAWDYGGQLSLVATPIRADLLQLQASGSYRQLTTSYFETRNKSDNFGFQAALGLLQNMPVSFQAHASRTWSDFNASAATTQTGATLSTTAGGTAVFHVEALPTLRAGLTRTDFENRGLGGTTTSGTSQRLALAGSHSLENQSYSASYDTSWNQGSFADSNYRNHIFAFQGIAAVARGLELRLSDSYFLRRPEQDALASTNPRYDDNALSADLFWRPGGVLSGSANYAYRHSQIAVLGSPDSDTIAHSFATSADYLLTPEWSVSGTGAVGRTESRLGDETRSAAGESVGAGVRWQRKVGEYDYSATASASVGLTQPETGKDLRAYGVGLGGGVHTSLAGWALGANLGASYNSNLLGAVGSSLRTTFSGTAASRFASGLQLRAQAQVSDQRQESDFLGKSSNQLYTLQGTAAFRTNWADLAVGLSNGASQNLVDPALSPTLPRTLNTASRFATLSGGTQLLDSVLAEALARYLETEAPARPLTWETAFNLRLIYRIGLFDLSLEDRYSVGGFDGFRSKVNVVLVRAARSFGMGL